MLTLIDELNVKGYAKKSPPIANFLEQHGSENLLDMVQPIASIFSNQKKWRNEFETYIKANSNSLCIVGNSANLLNKSLGKKIDTHAVVMRFNNYCSDVDLHEQCGESINIWVKAPDYKTQKKLLSSNIDWTIITGPDVLYTMSDWSNAKLAVDAGGRVITPPLRIWRDLVAILNAPPSAGILLIMWLIQIIGKADSLNLAGFQSFAETDKEQYHHSSAAHKAGERHNWKGEKALLQAWQKDGLKFLDRNVL